MISGRITGEIPGETPRGFPGIPGGTISVISGEILGEILEIISTGILG